jgi:hypothetical protein
MTTTPSAPKSSDVRWDTTLTRTHRSDIASAVATETEVVLSFGALEQRDQATSACLLLQIALRPAAAKNFRDMLRTLIADIDKGKTA